MHILLETGSGEENNTFSYNTVDYINCTSYCIMLNTNTDANISYNVFDHINVSDADPFIKFGGSINTTVSFNNFTTLMLWRDEGYYSSFYNVTYVGNTYDDGTWYALQDLSSEGAITVNMTKVFLPDGTQDFDLCLILSSAIGDVTILLEDGAIRCLNLPGLIGGSSKLDVDNALVGVGNGLDYVNNINEVGLGITNNNGRLTLNYEHFRNITFYLIQPDSGSNSVDDVHDNIFGEEDEISIEYPTTWHWPTINGTVGSGSTLRVYNNAFLGTLAGSGYNFNVSGEGNFYEYNIPMSSGDGGLPTLPDPINASASIVCAKNQSWPSSIASSSLWYNFSVLTMDGYVLTTSTSHSCSFTVPVGLQSIETMLNVTPYFVLSDTFRGHNIVGLINASFGEDGVFIALTLFLLITCLGVFSLPFIIGKFCENVVLDMILKRGCYIIVLLLMSLNGAIMASIVNYTSLNLQNEMFIYMNLLAWTAYTLMCYTIIKTFFETIKIINNTKLTKRMGED